MTDMTESPREQPLATPELDDIEQHLPPPVVPAVRIVGPVQVQQLPSRIGAIRPEPITNTASVRVLDNNPKRRRATIIGGQAWKPSTKKTVPASALPSWPANVAFVSESSDELWVTSSAASDTLAVIEEVWAD
jgi:hypothetical protein